MRSTFLFAMPSYMSGAARILDMGGTFDEYNSSRTPEEADAKALYADWSVIGQDLLAAVAAARSNEENPE